MAIVDELKSGSIPGFKDLRDVADALRELSVRLRKQGLGVSKTSLGFTFFQQLANLGIEPQLVSQWVKMCQNILPQESTSKSLLNAAARLVKAEKDSGLTYDEITAQCEAKAAEAKHLEARIAILEDRGGKGPGSGNGSKAGPCRDS